MQVVEKIGGGKMNRSNIFKIIYYIGYVVTLIYWSMYIWQTTNGYWDISMGIGIGITFIAPLWPIYWGILHWIW